MQPECKKIGVLSKFQPVNVKERDLGIPRRRWKDSIRMDLIEIGANTRI